MNRAGLFALITFGDHLRRDRARRRQLRGRVGLVGGLIAMVSATILLPPAPRLLWNSSASAPVGLYGVAPGALPKAGDTVIAWAPEPWRQLAAGRHYIPANVPLVKHVAAVPGDSICAFGQAIFVEGRRVTTRRVRDGQGRAMPWWTGCRILHDGEYFLLIPGVAGSFDGRYFGVTTRAQIIGTGKLLWPL